ncbi:MAG: alpha/beta hydrolase [Ruminococcaceae bacterium]|nr:alpha/beta hydrolase [Oscillospiraceae bacterium]
MFDRIKAAIFSRVMFSRHDINKAYAMVGPEDSWYDTITTVHNSLAQIQQQPHENWEITSHDGLALKAIYYPRKSDKTMIWVHGYTSHAERESAFPALFYQSMGYNVLIPYLRAHGPSEGKHITFGALEYRDVMGWVNRINELHPTGKILIHGLSMGGGIVLDLATKEMKNVRCLIADAPVGDVAGAFREMCNHIFKKHGNRVCDLVVERFQKQFGVDLADFNHPQTIKKGRYPLLVSAGSMENQEKLLELLKENNPMETSVVILPGCNHGNGMYKQTQLYQDAIREFDGRHMV